MKSRALIQILQAIIKGSYRMPRIIDDAGRFLIGDQGLKRFYRDERAAPDEYGAGWSGAGARLLVRSGAGAVRAALYYPDSMVVHLERHDPRDGIDDRNIDAFAILVEELDHLLTVACRAAHGRPVSLLELELHAGVTKYLLVIHFLGRLTGRRWVSRFHRSWARRHLFEKYSDDEGETADRYRQAARLARRYIDWFDRLDVPERRAELVAFHARPLGEQVRFIENLG